MYSLTDYGQMMADQARMDPYAYALKAVVKPDSVVLDIGTATGIHALLACKFGARKVYAVEYTDGVHLARDLARENGFEERIQFFQGLSTDITLPEPADVIVSDLRGVLPPFGGHISSIVDARNRHLRQGGCLIPQADTMWAALVSAPILYKELLDPWNDPYGFRMATARELVLSSWGSDNTDLLATRNMLVEPLSWFELDYRTVESPHLSSQKLTFEISQSGTAHGWFIWFDSLLTREIGYSSGPTSEKVPNVYGRGFFPLQNSIDFNEGDVVELNINATLINGEYEWSWRTRADSDGEILADFEQSTQVEASRSRYVQEQAFRIRPALSDRDHLELFVLNRVDGAKTVGQLTQQLWEAFPGSFGSRQEALDFVYDLTRAQ